MPLREHPPGAAARTLVAADGTPVGHFEERRRDGRPLAELFELAAGVAPEHAADVVMRELHGWRVVAREPFGRLLVAAGAHPRRHAHVMSRDLVADPPPAEWIDPPVPAGVRLTPVNRPARALGPACAAAFPPDHPDRAAMPTDPPPEDELEGIIAGRVLGPLLPCSGLAIDADDRVCGAVLVCDAPGAPPFDGPWIAQVFRDPAGPRVGGPLLRRALALAARDGLPALGLAVTHGNPALAVYAALGFVDVHDGISVDIDP